MRAWALALMPVLLIAPVARADKEQAKVHYRQGQTLYDLGRFQEASDEFEKAYEAYPDSALLFNLAQCQRQLGHTDRALFFYRGFLRNRPDAPNRSAVEKIIQELEA